MNFLKQQQKHNKNKNLTENEKVVMMKIKSKDICVPQVDEASLKV